MTRQLAELDKLKAEFVSVASHELKTPINVMIGYLQLLEEGIYGPLDAAAARHPQDARRAGEHAAAPREAVARRQPVRGRRRPSRAASDSARRSARTSWSARSTCSPCSARSTSACSVRTGLPDEVFWDLDRINEVLGNLLSNAFKFTPHGGTVELTFEPVGRRRPRCVVHDTGAGIPPEQLPRIFEKFYQADNQRAARAAGTGLGLAIAKQIVDAHGGTISCESTSVSERRSRSRCRRASRDARRRAASSGVEAA